MDNKTCSVDILGVSLGEEGYLIIPRQTRELCESLVKAADALEKALDDLPVDVTDKNRIAVFFSVTVQLLVACSS